MDAEERNQYGCPLHNQSGADGVRGFAEIIAGLSAELRAAYERERAARQAELQSIFAGDGAYRQEPAHAIRP